MDEYWEVPAVDAVGRPRTLRVVVSEGDVVLRTPPGEGVVVPESSIESLCDAIRAADSVAKYKRRLAKPNRWSRP